MVRHTRVVVTVWVVLRRSGPITSLDDLDVTVYSTEDQARSNVGYLDPNDYVIKEFTYYEEE